jgi:hypothetical protein
MRASQAGTSRDRSGADAMEVPSESAGERTSERSIR